MPGSEIHRMGAPYYALVVLLVAVLCAACRGERKVRAQVARSNSAELVAAAMRLSRIQASQLGDVPQNLRPAEFRKFDPQNVSVDGRGVYIYTYSCFVERAGLFIRTDATYDPPSAGDPGFEPIEADIYWFFAPG